MYEFNETTIEVIDLLGRMAEQVTEPEKGKLLTIADWVMDIAKDTIVKNINIQLKGDTLNTLEE